MKTLSDLALEIQLLRKNAHQTQSDLASAVGMQQEALSRFERGRGNDFSLNKFLRLVQALGYEVQLNPINRRPTLTDILEETRQSKNIASKTQ